MSTLVERLEAQRREYLPLMEERHQPEQLKAMLLTELEAERKRLKEEADSLPLGLRRLALRQAVWNIRLELRRRTEIEERARQRVREERFKRLLHDKEAHQRNRRRLGVLKASARRRTRDASLAPAEATAPRPEPPREGPPKGFVEGAQILLSPESEAPEWRDVDPRRCFWTGVPFHCLCCNHDQTGDVVHSYVSDDDTHTLAPVCDMCLATLTLSAILSGSQWAERREVEPGCYDWEHRHLPNVVRKSRAAMVAAMTNDGFEGLFRLLQWAMSASRSEVANEVDRLSGRPMRREVSRRLRSGEVGQTLKITVTDLNRLPILPGDRMNVGGRRHD
ncbi:MAG: hypothetical protein ACI4WT_11335 [Oligosphaeraceae bacterium]